MISLVVGIIFGSLIILIAATENVNGFPAKLAIALAGVSLILKTILIYSLSAGV